MMKDTSQDLRFACRLLARSPGITAVAVLSLALGIGANTAVFSLLNAVFLRALPVTDAERLMIVFTVKEGDRVGSLRQLSLPDSRDLSARTVGEREGDVFSALALSYNIPAQLQAENLPPEIVRGYMVSGNYFATLGMRPHLGRLIEPTDDGSAADGAVVVLSHAFWTRRCAADPALIGKTVRLNAAPFTVVGIAPPGFNGPMVITSEVFWAPVEASALSRGLRFEDRRQLIADTIARRRPGVSEAAARAAVEGAGSALAEAFPEADPDRGFTAVPLSQVRVPFFLRGRFSTAAGLLMTLTGLVLLIACANTTNLVLGRHAARRHELAMRRVLGASGPRLLRQLFSEGLVLAFLAGLAGLVVTVWVRQALWSLRPEFLRDMDLALGFDVRVLAFGFGVTLLVSLLVGLVPAWRAARSLSPVLAGIDAMTDTGNGRPRLRQPRHLLVMTQVALSFVALVAMGLFLKSLGNALDTHVGFEPEELLVVTMRFGFSDARPSADLLDRVLEETRALPGVEAASLTSLLPFTVGGSRQKALADGSDEEGVDVRVGVVDQDFVKAAGVDILRGRSFDRGNPRGVLVNVALAERLWPGEEAVGRSFRSNGENTYEVLGVIRDLDFASVGGPKPPVVFRPRPLGDSDARVLLVRTAAPSEVMEPLRQRIRALEPDLAVLFRGGEDLVSSRLWVEHLGAKILSVLGTVALLLAMIGIYAVTAATTRGRRREIAVRLALGAERRDVERLVLRQGMTVIAVGLVLGIALALTGGRLVAAMLHGVAVADGVVFAFAGGILAAVAFLVNLVPARGASGMSPGTVLAAER